MCIPAETQLLTVQRNTNGSLSLHNRNVIRIQASLSATKRQSQMKRTPGGHFFMQLFGQMTTPHVVDMFL